MSSIRLSHPTGIINADLSITGSKSESNRLLVLKQLYFPELEIEGLSESNDTMLMQTALNADGENRNVGDAGTVMRFLSAFFAVKEEGTDTIVLSGTDRMHQRPIGVLVEALKKIGADIEYLGEEGYPPLKINPKQLEGGEVEIDASISSQFISALMMIGPSMKKGLTLKLSGNSVSLPYLKITESLMNQLGLKVNISNFKIRMEPFQNTAPTSIRVEPDWSSASYWYLMATLSKEANIFLQGYRKDSIQGDAFVAQLFESFGVETQYEEKGVRILQKELLVLDAFTIDLVETPDLAQTLVVALAALNIPSKIRGLQTLRIKETDRLLALKTELEKTGAVIEIGADYLRVISGVKSAEGIVFDTWDDHRMAMALSPLALLGEISIKEGKVVRKSYPEFWKDLIQVDFSAEFE